VPAIGAMIETPGAATAAFGLTGDADFLSIGTNDLTHATLGSDRFSAVDAPTRDPAVLRNIDRSVRAAHEAGLPIEVCGEAASDPEMLPLLVGLDVDELSVGAARVGQTRAWIRELDQGECRERAQQALDPQVGAAR
jgi:phosphoenolpyruvate-protein kinase (PTS system EI component)